MSYSICMVIYNIKVATNLNMKTVICLSQHRCNQSTEKVDLCRNASRIWTKTTTRNANETFS